MHIADFDIGMLGANGIVAGGISIITGAGLAAQMEGKGGVAVSFFGDGASNAGPFHECLNIAATWKLPMLYVCENNMYAAQTSAAATHALPDVAAHAAGYGIPGIVVDGNDIVAVHQAAIRAVERARSGGGPTLIEAVHYRAAPHATADDPRAYIDLARVEEERARECVGRYEAVLKLAGVLTDEYAEGVRKDAEAQMRAGIAAAEAEAPADPELLFRHAYVDPPGNLRNG
jgi:pyruvate dehydrogenase E1 component alpha subunit